LRIAAGLPPEHDKKLLKEWKKDQKEMKDSGVRFKREQDKRFNLDSNITVYLVYFTSGLSHSGQMLYFKDSYKYNEKMRLEMRKPGRNRLNLPLKKK
jgi:murein L,D-transpeptidase YcbB/YkuD